MERNNQLLQFMPIQKERVRMTVEMPKREIIIEVLRNIFEITWFRCAVVCVI